MKTTALFLAVTSLLAGALQAANDEPKPTENLSGSRPNIIFFYSDDHACQALGAYGSKFGADVTPNLDAMAKRGLTFVNCICDDPLCGPSRASLITGKFSNENHFYSNEANIPFDESQVTLPKLMHRAGYQTAIFGKWHLISTPVGFDDFEVLTGQGVYYNPTFITPHGETQIKGYVTDITTQLALNWLQIKRNPDKPFILMIHQKAPHRDWMPGPDELNLFKGRVWPEPSTLRDTYAGKGKPIRDIRMRITNNMYFAYDLFIDINPHEFLSDVFHKYFNTLTPIQQSAFKAAYRDENAKFLKDPPKGDALLDWKYQRYITDYMRCIHGVDKGVGQILAYLKASGLDKNTIVMYSSDQSVFLGDHGWFDKRMPYNGSARMPLIVEWPGKLKTGARPKGIVQNVDFLPTFLDLAGAKIPAAIQGRSLVPMLDGADSLANRDAAYIHFYEDSPEHHVPANVAIRTEDYLYANYYVRHYVELFDLRKDPHELKNLANDPAYADVAATLKKQLKALAEKYNDKTAPWGEQKIPKYLTRNPLKFPPNAKPALTIKSDDVTD